MCVRVCFVVLVLAVAQAQFYNKDGRIIDEYGRERIFHGMNVVYKSDPYVPISDHFDPILSFSVEDAQLLQSLGLNVIRLGTQWAGVERTRGTYDSNYTDQIEKIVKICADYDISVFFDAHQDCFSERFCGEGVPLWAASSSTTFPMPLELTPWVGEGPQGIPTLDQCAKHQWASYQMSAAGAEAYDRLYRNDDGLADSFANFWGYLAKRFKGASNVIGFELLNEPFAGNFYKDPLLLFPGHADKTKLLPFYDRVAAVIRANDPDRLIMFEPCTWSDEYGMPLFDTTFDHVPGGAAYGNLSIYAYHYYPYVNKGSFNAYFDQRRNDSTRLGAAGFLTETDDLSNLHYFDDYLISWTLWEYKSFLPLANQTGLIPVCTGCGSALWDGGVFHDDNAYTISRSFAQAVQGRIISMAFNDTSNEFSLKFTADVKITQPTVIYLNEARRYSKGYDVSIQSDLRVNQTRSTNRLELFASASAALLETNDFTVAVKVVPK